MSYRSRTVVRKFIHIVASVALLFVVGEGSAEGVV